MYNPFEHFEFGDGICFLTGEQADYGESIQVFPSWLIERYALEQKTITMLAGNEVTYPELKLPCSEKTSRAVESLEAEIKSAFTGGYESVKKVNETRLLQWVGKIVYGLLYHDIVFAKNEQQQKGLPFRLSGLLTRKFSRLHLILQSLATSMDFGDTPPWTIRVVRVKYAQDVFNYKDETNNLNFSLGMNDFGIVACLQDNGANGQYHKELMQKIGNRILHPIQFEELCARFIYSNYLLKTPAKYEVHPIGDKLFLEAISTNNQTGLFNPWEDKMFSQVLANYWKPWGLTTGDIFSFPNSPISYLIDEYNNEIVDASKIALPF